MTHTGCLLATSDNEIGKIGPDPQGCGENRAILRCRPRLWTRHSLRTPPRLHPHGRGPVREGPILTRFSIRKPGSPTRRCCALGWNAIHLRSVNES